MTRKLTIPGDILELKGAVTPGISYPHTHYIKSPFEYGVQTCLVKIIRGDDAYMLGSVIAIQNTITEADDVREVNNPLLCGMLGIIDSAYKPYIEQFRKVGKKDLERTIESKSNNEFIIDSFPIQRRDKLAKINQISHRIITHPIVQKSRNTKNLKADIEELTRAAKEATIWNPYHLFLGTQGFKRSLKSFMVLSLWSYFERNRLSWEERAQILCHWDKEDQSWETLGHAERSWRVARLKQACIFLSLEKDSPIWGDPEIAPEKRICIDGIEPMPLVEDFLDFFEAKRKMALPRKQKPR